MKSKLRKGILKTFLVLQCVSTVMCITSMFVMLFKNVVSYNKQVNELKESYQPEFDAHKQAQLSEIKSKFDNKEISSEEYSVQYQAAQNQTLDDFVEKVKPGNYANEFHALEEKNELGKAISTSIAGGSVGLIIAAAFAEASLFVKEEEERKKVSSKPPQDPFEEFNI